MFGTIMTIGGAVAGGMTGGTAAATAAGAVTGKTISDSMSSNDSTVVQPTSPQPRNEGTLMDMFRQSSSV
ncbi:hypothetical protein [Vibrio splendidus]|nr:hypothetical protein [Vibrio splendidus]